MNDSYAEFVHGLATSKMHVTRVPADTLKDIIRLALCHADLIDGAKKALFYDKRVEIVETFRDMGPEDAGNEAYERLSGFLVHAILGIRSEADELLRLLLQALEGETVERQNWIDEGGDLMFYQQLLALASEVNVEMAGVVGANKAKLMRRYPEGFNAETAKNPNKAVEVQAQLDFLATT